MSFSFYSSRSGYSPKRNHLSGDAWDTARWITDNRLRAMRFWIERGSGKSDGHVKFLHSDLLANLESLATQPRDLYDDSSRARIHALIELIKGLGENDRPTFASVYALMDVAVPETVKGVESSFLPRCNTARRRESSLGWL